MKSSEDHLPEGPGQAGLVNRFTRWVGPWIYTVVFPYFQSLTESGLLVNLTCPGLYPHRVWGLTCPGLYPHRVWGLTCSPERRGCLERQENLWLSPVSVPAVNRGPGVGTRPVEMARLSSDSQQNSPGFHPGGPAYL